MATRRTERLLNLVICLLHTRRFLPASRIRELVPGYDKAPTDEAFQRMFERDKQDLRDLGIPLEVGSFGPWDDDPGYRIRREEYALPPVTFDPDEAAAVGLAARMWSNAALSEAATRAIRKLEAAGAEPAPLPEALAPRADSGEAGFPEVTSALLARRVLEFDYRGADDAVPSRRHVEPWGVVWWRGRWYLAGYDRDREAPRVFRLSRVTGTPRAVGPAGVVVPPADLDLAALVRDSVTVPATTARVRVRAGRGHDLRRTAEVIASAGEWDELSLPCPDPERLAAQLLPLGPDVVALEPPELRAAVIRRLRAIVA